MSTTAAHVFTSIQFHYPWRRATGCFEHCETYVSDSKNFVLYLINLFFYLQAF